MTIDTWFWTNIFLLIAISILSIMLIKERLFLKQVKLYLDTYNIKITNLNNFNSQLISSHLLQEQTNPSSITQFIYLTKENLSLRE